MMVLSHLQRRRSNRRALHLLRVSLSIKKLRIISDAALSYTEGRTDADDDDGTLQNRPPAACRLPAFPVPTPICALSLSLFYPTV